MKLIKNKNDEYTFYRNKEKWVHAFDGREFKVAKAVYNAFIANNSFNLFDESWDIEYIDGNPENCCATNLKLKR